MLNTVAPILIVGHVLGKNYYFQDKLGSFKWYLKLNSCLVEFLNLFKEHKTLTGTYQIYNPAVQHFLHKFNNKTKVLFTKTDCHTLRIT